ncbi:hypothetical protein [Faunimonas pinastri]|uniref:hypothetical protein n=1 Tax=Faunimonas pinastri TaxID=1855383 RepID=UPI00115FC013|nr:hypothetical protein [Faunimonas pinastri]
MPETITRAAIVHAGKRWHLPRPCRHHHIIARIAERAPETLPVGGNSPQGFLTSNNRFVDRVEGLKIAQAAGQIREKHGSQDLLFSEEMW